MAISEKDLDTVLSYVFRKCGDALEYPYEFVAHNWEYYFNSYVDPCPEDYEDLESLLLDVQREIESLTTDSVFREAYSYSPLYSDKEMWEYYLANKQDCDFALEYVDLGPDFCSVDEAVREAVAQNIYAHIWQDENILLEVSSRITLEEIFPDREFD